MSDSGTWWAWLFIGGVSGLVLWWAMAREKRQNQQHNRVVTHGRRVKATLREVKTEDGKAPASSVTLLVHEEGQGEDWLLTQRRFLSKPELYPLLVPGTVLDVVYDPEDRKNRVLIIQFDGEKLR